jgi:hypothetical protein
MNRCPQHTFIVLTKRADRMLELSPTIRWSENIWLGVTVEEARYKWTATKKGISYILVSFEKKEPQKHNSGEKTDLIELLGCTDDDGLPF